MMANRQRTANEKRVRNPWEYAQTDAGNAELFTDMFAQQLRYDHDQRAWYIWKDHWWEKSQRDEVVNFAVEIARARRKNAARSQNVQDEIHWATLSEMKPRLHAAIDLAKSHPKLATITADWKENPLLLGVANGVVNLSTGALESGNPADMIRAHSPVRFDANARCPTFQKFISTIFSNNLELIAYVQRAIGYTLTGLTKEQVAFLCHGEGGNGKTTFKRAVTELFGPDYADELPASVLDREKQASIPNDLMKLYGRRFCTMSELRENAPIDEARFKQITGEDDVAGRYLYANFVTFRPRAKIWFAFNHLPRILDTTHAFWRRMQLIPFTQSFDKNADKTLSDRIHAELSGVLNWAIEGCLAYQRPNGLHAPAIVIAAVEEYRRNSDPVLRFVDEICERTASAETTVHDLREAYESWANESGEPKLAARTFSIRLKQLGFKDIRMGHSRIRGFSGIRVTRGPVETNLLLAADRRTEEDGYSSKQ